jgi:hypothetical protein
MRVFVVSWSATRRSEHIEEITLDPVCGIFWQSHSELNKAALFIHQDVKEEVTLVLLTIPVVSLEVSLNELSSELHQRSRIDMLHTVARAEDINNLVSFICGHRWKQGMLDEVLLDMSPYVRLNWELNSCELDHRLEKLISLYRILHGLDFLLKL